MSITAPQVLAAVDLGSNSFHMIVAVIEDGQVHVLDKIKEMVRLGGGLDTEGNLDPLVAERALECLARFGQRLRDIPPHNVRIVGTMTLRQMNNSKDFITQAERAVGHSIETISGQEEARLIYNGVLHTHIESNKPRMIIDIGGRSTEIIVGKGEAIKKLVSTAMGCVSMSQTHFADGIVTQERFDVAETAARLIIRPHEHTYKQLKWKDAIGASGTAKALRDIAEANGWCIGELTANALDKMKQAMLLSRSLEEFQLEGLAEERKPVILGGLVIMRALFEALRIESMTISDGALREGVLYDMVEKDHTQDIRKRTIKNLQYRYLRSRNKQHKRVISALKPAIKQLARSWRFSSEDVDLLTHAANLHEIGRRIALSNYQKHSAYIIENSAMPGYSQLEQQQLALLVRLHRGRIRPELIEMMPLRLHAKLAHMIALLRIASLLHRSRNSQRVLPDIEYRATLNLFTLSFPKGWLESHPLTHADLQQEQEALTLLDMTLHIKTVD